MNLGTYFVEVGRPVAYYPSIAKLIGVKECIFLCQLAYWTGKGSDADGWIYKTQEEFMDETGLSPRSQRKARKALNEIGLLDERYSRLDHKQWYRLNVNALGEFLSGSFANLRNVTSGDDDPPLREVTDRKFDTITETTPETTAETTKERPASSEDSDRKDGLDGKNTSPSEPPQSLNPPPSTSETPQTPPTPKKSKRRDYSKEFTTEELALYEAYPRKEDKPAALMAIRRALKKCDYDDLLEAVNEYAEARSLAKDPTYTRHPATWFNKETWNNDHEAWYPKGCAPKEAAFQKRLKEIKEKMSDWDNTTPAEGVRLNKERLALMERGHL